MPLLALRVSDIIKGIGRILEYAALHEDCPYWYILGVILAGLG
jgi:hypothetical protein